MRIQHSLILIIIAIIPLYNANAKKQNQPFSLLIQPAQGMVKAGSDVKVEVSLTNTSGRDIGILKSGSDYTVEVRDLAGKLVPDTKLGRRLKAPDSVAVSTATPLYPLKPNQSLKDEVVVSKLSDMSAPGRYSIQLTRTVPEEMGKGVVKSNTITVTVTP